jgi:DNA (cytosine-5)-methyltransferase 1
MVPYSKLRINWRTLPSKGDSAREAYITHYLHSKGTEHSRYFIKQAFEYLGEIGLEPRDIRKIRQVAWDIPFPPPARPRFSFIDLFCGIGGFRLSFQTLGGKCVFSSDIDYHAKRTYEYNFGEVPFDNIMNIDEKEVPDHDILLAGFPCQAFSIAGRRAGFEDTRGILFFEVARIIKEKKPKVVILENVKGLISHNKGKTFKTIVKTLRKELGYYVPEPQVLNAKNYGLAQNRERVFIVGFHESTGIKDFEYPKPSNEKVSFSDVKEEEVVPSKYYLSTSYLKSLKEHRKRHEEKGNGFGYEIIQDDDIANAVVVGGMGRERNLVLDYRITDFTPTTNIKGQVNREGIRKMTPREWARLQGFPDRFQIAVSDAQAYKQFGNSVAVNAVQAVGQAVIDRLELSL